ncbi:MAG: ABC-ATPase domain-containing protein [Thermoplasmata archaeon]|nr:ABC-ATPase domain-containing protein [Thermoplasmata archaeon]
MRKLAEILERIDGRSYVFYRDIEGKYRFENFTLYIDRVQSDPFAPPSDFRIVINNTFPEELYGGSRLIAFEDFLTRKFHAVSSRLSKKCGSGKSGVISILKPSQQILRRSCVRVGDKIEVLFHVGLPAYGRRIAGKEAKRILLKTIPDIVRETLLFKKEEYGKIKEHVEVYEDATFIRNSLKSRGLVAFIADNSILPRESGISEKPLKKAIRFISPDSMREEFNCPNRDVTGMGVKEGVTLIVGGAYHGKSTLLDAISKGVYNHVVYDGREFVITREDAVKIRAEDGRYVANVDISPFISNLPNNVDTSNFSTENASGSTSQAANISEAIEMGSRLLLIDEDTSATNLMMRDRRMQELVPKDKEPITPLIDMIPSLRKLGVSIVMVAGGIGEYFDVADTVIMMDSYKPLNVTDKAKEIARKFKTSRLAERPEEIKIKKRCPLAESINPYIKGKKKIKAMDISKIRFGRYVIDLDKVEQIVEIGQTRAIGDIILELRKHFSGNRPMVDILKEVEGKILEILPKRGDYSEPRIYEIAFAINRLRSLKCRQLEPDQSI